MFSLCFGYAWVLCTKASIDLSVDYILFHEMTGLDQQGLGKLDNWILLNESIQWAIQHYVHNLEVFLLGILFTHFITFAHLL